MNGRTNSNNNTTGLEIEVPLDPVTNVSTSAGDGQVELTWTDPLDKYAATEGKVAEFPNPIVSQWDHTRVVRKENTQPTGPNDGVIILSSDVRNQYQSTSYVDSGLVNDTLYHYGLFACNTAGLFSTGAFGSATPKTSTPLSQLPEGTIIKINENGSPVEFYLAKHNYEEGLNGAGRELFVRKDIFANVVYKDSGSGSVAWRSSDIKDLCNNTYKPLFSEKVQQLIGTTTIYCKNPFRVNPIVVTDETECFILSVAELGFPDSSTPDGTELPIANLLRTATYNGEAASFWTRTNNEMNRTGVYYMNSSGSPNQENSDYPYGARPCFTLPASAIVDTGLNLVEQ